MLFPLSGYASPIKLEHSQFRTLGTVIKSNAQITQLSNQKQEIVSRLKGHLEKYFVQAGAFVKAGEKVALIESIELSKMTAEYLALVQQANAAKIQKNANKKLNKKGLSSQNDLSNAIIALEEIRSKQNALASQLQSLGLSPSKLKNATDKFFIYAHADGVVGKVIAPLHSNVDAQTLLMTLVNQNHYYALAYLSVEDAMKMDKTSKGWIHISQKSYATHFVQVLPTIDAKTQRAKVLFEIEDSPKNLLLGAFVAIDISLASKEKVIIIKKSALTLYQGEWVVFTKKAHEDEKHDEHGDEKHDEHGDEEEIPYEASIIEIIAYAGDFIAIRGLAKGQEYVSEGVYFVKSMLLKSSLGEHGH
jgi:multidrug efflux pump subunit AcrA (membrane-fusion protein)